MPRCLSRAAIIDGGRDTARTIVGVWQVEAFKVLFRVHQDRTIHRRRRWVAVHEESVEPVKQPGMSGRAVNVAVAVVAWEEAARFYHGIQPPFFSFAHPCQTRRGKPLADTNFSAGIKLQSLPHYCKQNDAEVLTSLALPRLQSFAHYLIGRA